MNTNRNPVEWFEIYAQDMKRANTFYQMFEPECFNHFWQIVQPEGKNGADLVVCDRIRMQAR
jgi:hypothetical protein